MAHARLTLYTRANCPLCDEAREALARAKRELGDRFEFDVVDIEGDERLTKEFGALIPVVARGDEVLFIGKVSVHRLKALVGEGSGSPPRATPRYKKHLERLAARLRGVQDGARTERANK